jgi:LAO/AO transport system kinase
MVPGMGDDIQAIKAGILEIADVFVVNKADRDGADRTVRDLAVMLEMSNRREGEWLPRVMKTEASRGVGIDELVAEFENHRNHLFTSGVIERFTAEKNTAIFTDMLKERLFRQLYDALVADGSFNRIVAGMATREIDPYSAVDAILAAAVAYPSAALR